MQRGRVVRGGRALKQSGAVKKCGAAWCGKAGRCSEAVQGSAAQAAATAGPGPSEEGYRWFVPEDDRLVGTGWGSSRVQRAGPWRLNIGASCLA